MLRSVARLNQRWWFSTRVRQKGDANYFRKKQASDLTLSTADDGFPPHIGAELHWRRCLCECKRSLDCAPCQIVVIVTRFART